MRFRISKLQAFLLVFVTSFCTTPFGFITLYSEVGRHVWLAGLLQLVVCMIGAGGVCLLLGRMPESRLDEISTRLLGPWLGRAYMALLGLFYLLWGPVGNLSVLIGIREAIASDFTPPLLVAATMTAAALYACRSGLEVIARTVEVWGWVLVPGIFLLVLVPYIAGYGHFRVGFLLPVQPLPVSVATSATVWSYAIGARGFILALILAGRTVSGRALLWPVLGGTAAAAILLTVMITAPAVTFPTEVLKHFRYPVLEVLDTVDLASFGLHSTVTVTLLIWPVISWAVVASALWASAESLAGAVGMRSYRPLLWPLAAASCILASWRFPLATFTRLAHGWSLLAYVVGIAGPWVMWALAALRQRRARRRRGVRLAAEHSRG